MTINFLSGLTYVTRKPIARNPRYNTIYILTCIQHSITPPPSSAGYSGCKDVRKQGVSLAGKSSVRFISHNIRWSIHIRTDCIPGSCCWLQSPVSRPTPESASPRITRPAHRITLLYIKSSVCSPPKQSPSLKAPPPPAAP